MCTTARHDVRGACGRGCAWTATKVRESVIRPGVDLWLRTTPAPARPARAATAVAAAAVMPATVRLLILWRRQRRAFAYTRARRSAPWRIGFSMNLHDSAATAMVAAT